MAVPALIPAASPTASPTPVAATQTDDAVKGADQIRDAVSEQSMTIGQIVDWLDSMGFTIGDTHLSLWGVLLVIMVIAGVIVFARLASKGAHIALARMTRLSPTQSVLVEKLVTLAVWAFAIMVGVDLLGIDLTAFAVFSGAFGLAIGFGLQKTFGNLIAGMILLMDRSIKPGDVIAVTDMAGNETFGQIRKIGIRAISVTTRDEREYLIPNENLMINQVENWSFSSRNVRIQVPVGISYNCDIHVAEKMMLEAAQASKRVLELPAPSVWLNGFGDSSVDFTIHCWIRDPEMGVGNVRSEVLKKLWDLFKENGIEIPFPQRDINLRRNAQFDRLVEAIALRAETLQREKPRNSGDGERG
ncbi:MAG TPA: mechanosensitive ion channel domain-containing protein [Croceicoccus sp.]|nr:mechanosensitive ion channel domain-containing protein [Croceicoccus sp.]